MKKRDKNKERSKNPFLSERGQEIFDRDYLEYSEKEVKENLKDIKRNSEGMSADEVNKNVFVFCERILWNKTDFNFP